MKKYKLAMLLVSLVILAVVVAYANPFVVADLLAKSDYRFIALGFGLSLFSILLGVLKWRVLLKGVSFAELTPVQILGFTISNFTPGKAAEPAKAIILKARKGLAVSSTLTSIVWERVMDVLVLIIFAAVSISPLSLRSDYFILAGISIAIFVLIIAVSISVLYSRRFGNKLFGIIRKLPLLNKLPENFMDKFYKIRIKKRRLAACFVIALVSWAVIGFVLYSALLAFGVVVSPIILIGIVSLSIVIGIASSLPGGLGTTEVVMIFLLGIVGVDHVIAAAAAITFRLMTIWFVNVMGGLSFIYLSRKFKIKNIF